MPSQHTPVMLKEVIDLLSPKSGDNFIDATAGGGSYALELAKRIGSKGKLLAIDADAKALERTEERLKKAGFKNIITINDNFKNLHQAIPQYFSDDPRGAFAGVVFDLGLSSDQLADRDRGFSFQLAAPLDMAFGPSTGRYGRSVKDILDRYSESEIRDIIKNYGEERYAGRIAGGIVRARQEGPIGNTSELAEIIRQSVPADYQRQPIHYATRTFQALRIYANDELGNLEQALPRALEFLALGGRLAVVSYHSLEDRIAKQFIKGEARECHCPPEIPICRCQHQPSLRDISRGVITPSEREIKANPRSRSAKLRVAEKIV